MNPERLLPINNTPSRKATLTGALKEMVAREAGPPNDPDGYLAREAPPSDDLRAQRDAEVAANQTENLN